MDIFVTTEDCVDHLIRRVLLH